MLRGAPLVRPVFRVLALAVVAACSEKAPLPAELQDCDAGRMCGTVATGGGQGASGTSSDSGNATCGTISSADPSCNTCIKTTCCDRDATCSANPDCIELVRCVGGCANAQACITACRDRSQNGVADYDNFQFCVSPACDTSCAGTDAGSACGVLVFQSAQCNLCMSTNCCSENATCSNNPDCFALSQCAAACANDQVCIMNCRVQHPNGSTAYTSLQECGQLNCTSQCQ